MGNDDDGARAKTQDLVSGGFSENFGLQRPSDGASARAGGFIAVIEGRTFLRECISRSMQSAFLLPVVAYSAVSELESQLQLSPRVIILSLVELGHEASLSALKALSERAPGVPIIVLAYVNDVDLARTAIRHGAKGSNTRPSPIVACSINCVPHKSQPQMIQTSLPEASNLPQII